MKKKLMVKICDYLEKKLYADPTYEELAKALDKTRYKLVEAKVEIDYLQSLLKQAACRR